MGMDWLKGLVGASDQMVPAGQPMPQQGAPWGQQYGAPQGGYPAPGGYPPPGGQPGYGAPPGAAQAPQQQWGAPPPAAQAPQQQWGAPPPAAQAPQQQWAAPPQTWGAAPQAAAPQAVPQGTPAWGAPSSALPAPELAPVAPVAADARVAALEARCEELGRDVHAIALFARTLLALLEEKQIVTEAQFVETRRRLDALDGKPAPVV